MSKSVKVVVKQLMLHINSTNLHNPKQSAYKAGHFTPKLCCCISKMKLHLSLSRGKPAALVLLNLLAAFDTINHTTLFNCLKSWFAVALP